MDTPADAVASQLRKGVVEYCVLAALGNQRCYAPHLATQLTERGLLTSERDLAPLLSRLRKRGLVEITWPDRPDHIPIHYFQLTVQGWQALSVFTQAWTLFTEDISTFLKESQ